MEPMYMPSLYLSDDKFPQIKKWENGKTYKVVLELKQISSRVSENGGAGSAELKILGMKEVPMKSEMKALKRKLGY